MAYPYPSDYGIVYQHRTAVGAIHESMRTGLRVEAADPPGMSDDLLAACEDWQGKPGGGLYWGTLEGQEWIVLVQRGIPPDL